MEVIHVYAIEGARFSEPFGPGVDWTLRVYTDWSFEYPFELIVSVEEGAGFQEIKEATRRCVWEFMELEVDPDRITIEGA